MENACYPPLLWLRSKIRSTMYFVIKRVARNWAPPSTSVLRSLLPAESMEVTSDKSTVSVVSGLPTVNASQVRSSSLTQGPASLPSSLIVVGREPFCTVILSIVRKPACRKLRKHSDFQVVGVSALANKSYYYI